MKNLINRIKRKLNERRQQAAYQSVVVGFGWAMAAYYLEREPLEEIKAQLSVTRDFGDWTSFDDGAQAAVEVIEGLSGENIPSSSGKISSAQTFQKFLDYALLQEADANKRGNIKEASKWQFISLHYLKFAAEEATAPKVAPDASTEEKLVHRLVMLGDVRTAPNRSERVAPHSSVLVGIGKDHTAELILDNEALAELIARNGETS